MSSQLMFRLRVAVLHSSPFVSAGVMHLLAAESDLNVVEPLAAERPEVLIADHHTAVAMLQAPPQASQSVPPLLVLSSTQRERDICHAIELGVRGYLMLASTPMELLNAVRAVGKGLRWLCPEAAARVADSMAQVALTHREEEVLSLLVAGFSNKLIALRLNLALGTVKTHVKAILQKLDARSRTEAISICMQRGLIRTEASEVPLAKRNGHLGSTLTPRAPSLHLETEARDMTPLSSQRLQ
jgi:DNA-binding NarL/FixJ family response regulator